MITLIILDWKNSDEPLKNENGWPIKGFKIRLLKCTAFNKRELKNTLKEITQKSIKKISLTTKNNEEILSLIDYFSYYGAKIEVIQE